MYLVARDHTIDLGVPRVMGIWNVSPDSFSSSCEPDDAAGIAHAESILADGADMIDIGAESTRPGAVPVTSAEEIARLRQPLAWAHGHLKCPVSLDSYHLETVRWALSTGGIDIVNDIGVSEVPLQERDGAMYAEAAAHGAAVILMAWMPHDALVLPFQECMKKIVIQLEKRLEMALRNGVGRHSVVLDPGIGFGKGPENDMRLIAQAPGALAHLGCPVLIAHSRKRCLAKTVGLPIGALDIPTAMASAIAFAGGASIVRVHRPGLSCQARQIAASCCTHHG